MKNEVTAWLKFTSYFTKGRSDDIRGKYATRFPDVVT